MQWTEKGKNYRIIEEERVDSQHMPALSRDYRYRKILQVELTHPLSIFFNAGKWKTLDDDLPYYITK